MQNVYHRSYTKKVSSEHVLNKKEIASTVSERNGQQCQVLLWKESSQLSSLGTFNGIQKQTKTNTAPLF